MRKKIVGQDEAVKDVSLALRRLPPVLLTTTNRQEVSFFWVQAALAKLLRESFGGKLFWPKNAMISFDMSEFSYVESVLIFTDRLTNAIEQAPFSLVFFDELEKSNVFIRNLLLQVLDEGRLTRSSGREASFRDALIIATSNAGSSELIDNPNIEKKILINDLIRNGVFSPEFLNRFNDVVLFKPLDASEARKIASLLLSEFAERFRRIKKSH